MSTYEVEWDIPPGGGGWLSNTVFLGGIAVAAVVMILRAVLTSRATKRTGETPRAVRRCLGWLTVVIFVPSLIASMVTERDYRQGQEAAMLNAQWHVTIIDVDKLPNGVHPQQGVSIDVVTPRGRETCVLSSWARHGHGAWLTGIPGRGGGKPQMRFEMTCP